MTPARNLVLATLCLLLVAGLGCPKRGAALRDDPKGRCVSKLLDAMMDDDKDRMGKLISPEWLDEENIDLDDYQINAYTPSAYEIEEIEGSTVTALIHFESGGAHRLEFEVSKEDGKYYIVPGEADEEMWIHPWTDVETNIEE